jgi:IS30 family transposase
VKQYRGYYPVTAQDSARRRRRRKLVRDPRRCGQIVEKLKLCWSPEQIAGRFKLTGEDGCLCHETIYQFVYSPEGRALELHRHLLREDGCGVNASPANRAARKSRSHGPCSFTRSR